MDEAESNDGYASCHLFFTQSLESLRKWKSVKKGSEIVGLAIAIGAYLLKSTFLVFVGVVLVVIAAWAIFAYLESSTFDKIRKKFAGLHDSGTFETFQDGERKELARLFDLAEKEVSANKGKA